MGCYGFGGVVVGGISEVLGRHGGLFCVGKRGFGERKEEGLKAMFG